MSLPPSRVGGVRGPNGTTLDDLFVEQEKTNTRLGQLVEDSAIIRDAIVGFRADFRSLWGEVLPAGWPGLGFLIERVVGIPDEGSLTVQRWLQALWGAANSVNLNLGADFGGDDFDDLSGWQQEGRRVYQTLNVALGTLPWYEDGTLAKILAVLGQVGNPPIGSTLKDLIRSIDTNTLRVAECCEEGGVDPPSGNNPPPDTVCATGDGWGPKVRVAAWERLNGTSLPAVWGAVFPITTLPVNLVPVGDVSPTYDWPGISTDITAEGLEACYSWNTTGETWTGSIERVVGSRVNWPSGASGNVPTFERPIGNAIQGIVNTLAYGLRVITDTDTPPGLNFFLSSLLVS